MTHKSPKFEKKRVVGSGRISDISFFFRKSRHTVKVKRFMIFTEIVKREKNRNKNRVFRRQVCREADENGET